MNAIPHLPLASLHAHGSTKDPTPDPALRVDSTCYINCDQVTPHNGTEQASHLIEKIPRGDVRGEGGIAIARRDNLGKKIRIALEIGN